MMLRSLLHELVRRRLWPIPLVALLVAVAAPLLFLKSASPDAPLATAAAPAAAEAGRLPARAERLLATTDGAVTGRGDAAGPAHDPFEPPSSHRPRSEPAGAAGGGSRSEAAASSSGSAPVGSAKNPLALTIKNPDGSTQSATGTLNPVDGGPTKSPGSRLTAFDATVDVRFGERDPARTHRRVQRLQPFTVGGKVVAIFVKYSPSRDKAVFAIAPTTIITGDVECRRKQGVCRYVDIPAGAYARLTAVGADGSVVSRRLDVLRVNSGTSALAAGAAAVADGRCLLRRMLALRGDHAPLADSACGS